MWLGEQIDEYGIGNGISLLIMAGILASMPAAGFQLIDRATFQLGDTAGLDPPKLLLLATMFIGVVAGTVYITLGQRRITMQSAKHMRGRRASGGGKSYLPIKVNQAGVMPIIFASSLLMFPMLVFWPTRFGCCRLGRWPSEKHGSRPRCCLWARDLYLQLDLLDSDLLLLLLLDSHHLQSQGDV